MLSVDLVFEDLETSTNCRTRQATSKSSEYLRRRRTSWSFYWSTTPDTRWKTAVWRNVWKRSPSVGCCVSSTVAVLTRSTVWYRNGRRTARAGWSSARQNARRRPVPLPVARSLATTWPVCAAPSSVRVPTASIVNIWNSSATSRRCRVLSRSLTCLNTPPSTCQARNRCKTCSRTRTITCWRFSTANRSSTVYSLYRAKSNCQTSRSKNNR